MVGDFNKTRQDHNTERIQSRLDYFLISHILEKSIKRTEIQALFLEVFNTFVLYLDTFVTPPLRRKLFKFNKFFFSQDGFIEYIKNQTNENSDQANILNNLDGNN